jgi:hypothetical protein
VGRAWVLGRVRAPRISRAGVARRGRPVSRGPGSRRAGRGRGPSARADRRGRWRHDEVGRKGRESGTLVPRRAAPRVSRRPVHRSGGRPFRPSRPAGRLCSRHGRRCRHAVAGEDGVAFDAPRRIRSRCRQSCGMPPLTAPVAPAVAARRQGVSGERGGPVTHRTGEHSRGVLWRLECGRDACACSADSHGRSQGNSTPAWVDESRPRRPDEGDVVAF